MVRTLDGNVRAFLSDRYRRLDHHDLLQHVLPVLSDVPGLTVASCEVTETRLYLQVTTPRLQGEVKVGDVVQMGLLISNSEVGMGRLNILPMSLRLWCLNGATHQEFGTRKNHVGKTTESDENYQMLSDETLEADDKAFFLKVRDTVKGTLSEVVLGRVLDQMKEAAGILLEANPVTTVERLANRYRLPETEKESILTHLVSGSDLSMFGLANAVTRAASDAPLYDRAVDLQALGGSLMNLPKLEIQALAAPK